MEPAIEQVLIESDSISSLADRIAGEPGFVSMFHPLGRFYTARPDRSWTLGGDLSITSASINQAIDYYRQNLQQPVPPGSFRAFHAGLVGVLGYELGGLTVPGFRSRKSGLPENLGWIGAYSWALHVPTGGEKPQLRIHPGCPHETRQWLYGLISDGSPPDPTPFFSMKKRFNAARPESDYLSALDRILDYIKAGDCYQVNLSRKFAGLYQGNPWQAWKNLYREIPVPYGAYLDAGDTRVLSISPEQFLRISAGEVSSKPIKGTRSRGETPSEDLALRENLLNHPKDRAENLMIVDLIRNDLSRFCERGSVRVPEMFRVESYRNVHQLVSRVTGRLQPDTEPLRALLSAFPGGSITGAPKRRAMEIIDELESHTRDPYCGSVFFLDQDNNLDSNIAIRTLEAHPDGRIHCWGGGGIVADSVPDEELRETEFKVRRLMDILEEM